MLFFQTLFSVGETMPCPFQGSVIPEILHIQEKKTKLNESPGILLSELRKVSLRHLSVTPTSQITGMLVLEPDQAMWWC